MMAMGAANLGECDFTSKPTSLNIEEVFQPGLDCLKNY
jgi:hypothetical protein